MNGKPPTPKRGAFPTPKDVLDNAPRYTPEHDTADDQQSDKTNLSPDRTQPRGDRGGAKNKEKDSRQK
jgi:hypothetical protein